jgi:hypothetical protein
LNFGRECLILALVLELCNCDGCAFEIKGVVLADRLITLELKGVFTATKEWLEFKLLLIRIGDVDGGTVDER